MAKAARLAAKKDEKRRAGPLKSAAKQTEVMGNPPPSSASSSALTSSSQDAQPVRHDASAGAGNTVFPDLAEQERAVEAAKATIPSSASRDELRRDPIYRIMHALPRSDVLEVVRSRFAAPHCARAAAYFDLSYMKNPLRHLRLQVGCDGPTGLYLFFPRIAAHRHTLRVLDLSRNRLTSDDCVLLCNALGLGREGSIAAARVARPLDQGGDHSFPEPTPSTTATAAGSSLELLDLSYNTRIGNDGALHVLRAVQRHRSIRAVILKSVGVDDAGALAVSDVLRSWPAPVAAADGGAAVYSNALRSSTAAATKFYLNLNENYIGARGTHVLGKGLQHHVSLTLIKQRLAPCKEGKRLREAGGGGVESEQQRKKECAGRHTNMRFWY